MLSSRPAAQKARYVVEDDEEDEEEDVFDDADDDDDYGFDDEDDEDDYAPKKKATAKPAKQVKASQPKSTGTKRATKDAARAAESTTAPYSPARHTPQFAKKPR